MPRRKRFDALAIRENFILADSPPMPCEPEYCYLCGTPTGLMYSIQGTSQPMPLCVGCAKGSSRQLELGE